MTEFRIDYHEGLVRKNYQIVLIDSLSAVNLKENIEILKLRVSCVDYS